MSEKKPENEIKFRFSNRWFQAWLTLEYFLYSILSALLLYREFYLFDWFGSIYEVIIIIIKDVTRKNFGNIYFTLKKILLANDLIKCY